MAPHSYPGSPNPNPQQVSIQQTLKRACHPLWHTSNTFSNNESSHIFCFPWDFYTSDTADALGFLVVNSSPIGLAYHASDAGTPPKIRYRTALELDDIPAIRAEDEGFWMMLVTGTNGGDCFFFLCVFFCFMNLMKCVFISWKMLTFWTSLVPHLVLLEIL